MNQDNRISLNFNSDADRGGWSILKLAFRPFFLLGGLLAVVYVFLWVNVFTGNINFQVYGGTMWWHIHEMLYGFVGAIVVGFLLTAVQTWTQLPGVKGVGLFALVLLWILGRGAMFAVGLIPPGVIAFIDLLFLPAAAILLSVPIIKRRMWRNLIFVPILLLMTYTNAHMHCSVFLPGAEHLFAASQNQVLLMVLLMVIIGGRVMPMFTANGTGTTRVPPIGLIERASVGLVFLIVILQLMPIDLPLWLKTMLLGLAAVINAVRVFRWRIWVTWRTPMVLFLHVSYWCIPLGLGFYAMSEYGLLLSRSQAIHTLTVGAIGIMILSMISRVSLGHTGRPILAGKIMTVAFFCVFLAFIARVFGQYVTGHSSHIFMLSGGFWIIGYGLFLIRYVPILCSPRADGRPG